ncbi:uncharacterized protein KD926_001936 [Aspergillus affinis]|uniref:uncharacterized protein n=1 Tax=Aspergillus affinis TaxID=1070780 RepID=UPI0022FF19F1|nr:uncharacterized protein KD926_001936 [Aspergillus affinis]KAI9044112.1 hypothetical protein KD926_001936 [Aspergillus affinis]
MKPRQATSRVQRTAIPRRSLRGKLSGGESTGRDFRDEILAGLIQGNPWKLGVILEGLPLHVSRITGSPLPLLPDLEMHMGKDQRHDLDWQGLVGMNMGPAVKPRSIRTAPGYQHHWLRAPWDGIVGVKSQGQIVHQGFIPLYSWQTHASAGQRPISPCILLQSWRVIEGALAALESRTATEDRSSHVESRSDRIRGRAENSRRASLSAQDIQRIGCITSLAGQVGA